MFYKIPAKSGRRMIIDDYLCQNILVKSKITVKISRRPTSMRNEANHLPMSGTLAHVNAGPVAPSAGPVLPRAEIVDPNAVSKDSPKHCMKKQPKIMSIKKIKMNANTFCTTIGATE